MSPPHIQHMPTLPKPITTDALPRYASIPMRLEVSSILEVTPGGLDGLAMRETPVTPYTKDYDVDGSSPLDWSTEFDTSNWGFFLTEIEGKPAGGAAVAYNTNGVHMLEGRSDLGVLWDLRVDPAYQGRGIGRALVAHAADWLRRRGCRWLKIETQNTNVAACRFYQACGCELGAVNRFAYTGTPEVAHEAMLLWYLDLQPPTT